MKAKGRKQAGFTLIEVLVAIAVLGAAVTPVLGLFAAASRSIHNSKRNTVALMVARDIMDRIKAGDINPSNGDRRIKDYREQYGVEILVSGKVPSEGGTLKLIKVYVTPRPGMDPRAEGIMLSSYASDVIKGEMDTMQLYLPVPGDGSEGVRPLSGEEGG